MEKRVQFKEQGSSKTNYCLSEINTLVKSSTLTVLEPINSNSTAQPRPQKMDFKAKPHISPSVSPSRQKINIVFVGDLELESVTSKHRRSLLDCVNLVCKEMEANLVQVQYHELSSSVHSALDSFYDADAAILDITIEDQRNSLFYHLGVRESFSMKQNILVVANLLDNTNFNDKLSNDLRGTPLSHEAASQIKSLLPNYPLLVYFIQPKAITNDNEQQQLSNNSEMYECFVDQNFIDLTYSPGSDEQMDPSLPDFDDDDNNFFFNNKSTTTPIITKNNEQISLSTLSINNSINSGKYLTPTVSEEMSLQLKGQLKEALKNVKWQAKAHMKDKFLADLKKARQSYQGEELVSILNKFRQRLNDPNMLSTDVVYQMLVSFQEVQDYNAMVELVDDLSRYPNLNKITSSPQIVFHHAFALNRRHKPGDSDRALKLITTALEIKEHQNPDSICLCGRIFKDRFIESNYNDRESLKNAIDWYRRGFKISPNEYAAINLATLLYIAGHDFKTSNELKHVGLVLNNLIGKKGPVHKLENYWDVATYFEFCLLANQFGKAIEAASCMFLLKPNKWHLKSTIGNIKLIYEFKPKITNENFEFNTTSNSTMTTTTNCSQQLQSEIIQSPEEQIVEFWMDFFIDAVQDSCDNQIRFAALVLEQNNEYMPTYITMNLDVEEKSITISQMCITHLRDLNGCRKPHLWHIKATGVRGISLYKRDERCVYLYVHDNSDDFQIFFPSELLRARFRSLVLSITGNRSIDISANLKDTERKINFVYELNKDESRIILGRGSKGIVYAARDVDTQTQIAIKEVPVKNIGEVQPLHEEIRLHSMLRHRNIVQYLGTSHEGNYFRIIMERVPGGSLSQLLQRDWGPLNENVIAYYSRQILDGLQYLHRQKIVHRDIKGDNVLVNTYTGILKISDFGTCKRLAAINPNTETFAGTVPFMAPELLDRGQRGYSMPADIWSFGCTVVEMASGKPPFIEISSGAQVMFRVGFYKEHPEIPAKLSEKCKQFIERCFEPNTEYRATCDQLLQDPFLDETRRPTSSASVLHKSTNSSGLTRTNSRKGHRPSSSSAAVAAAQYHYHAKPVNNVLKSPPTSSVSSEKTKIISNSMEVTQQEFHSTTATTGQNAHEVDQVIKISNDEQGGEEEDLESDYDGEDDHILQNNEDDDDDNDDHSDDDDYSDSEILTLTQSVQLQTNKDLKNYQAGLSGTKLLTHTSDSSGGVARDTKLSSSPPTVEHQQLENEIGRDHHRGRRRHYRQRNQLVELNQQLDDENRKLWTKLYQVQMELRELLTSQLQDKQSQMEALMMTRNNTKATNSFLDSNASSEPKS